LRHQILHSAAGAFLIQSTDGRILKALYALDLFNWDDPNQKTSFVVTLVLVAGTTYGFAGYLVWFVRDPKQRKLFQEAKRVRVWFKQRKRRVLSDGGSDSG
jgi:hypothetical protein